MNIFKLIICDLKITHYINRWKVALKNREKFEVSTDDYELWEIRCIYYCSEYEAVERDRLEVIRSMKTPLKK